MQTEHIQEEMMARYLNGDVTAEEQAEMDNWLLQDKANQQRLEQVRQIWAVTAMPAPVNDDAEAAWLRMKQRAAQNHQQDSRRRIVWLPTLVRIAAVLLLMISLGTALHYYSKDKGVKEIAKKDSIVPMEQKEQAVTIAVPQPEEKLVAATPVEKKTKEQTKTPDPHKQKPIVPATPLLATADKVKQPIINNTLCPLEICIRQTVQCHNDEASAFAHCSLIAPDESGQIRYTQFNQHAGICAASIEEISIKRVSTGETIVLNAASSPVTAQEFFDYITGKKTGGIEAGVFEADCNNLCLNEPLKLDNRLGSLVLQ